MNASPLFMLRRMIRTPADAANWACILEATAPKAGNVYPGESFDDLTHADFMTAAAITSRAFAPENMPITQRMLSAVSQTYAATKTNVNLGIVLLLGPLIAADERLAMTDRDDQSWRDKITEVLQSFDVEDGRRVYAAINAPSAGGLGEVDSMDVRDDDPRVDILAAMESAQHRDRIAHQWAGGFVDLFDNVVPVIDESIRGCGDVLSGIAIAHVRLLAETPDTLIARKCGWSVADDVQQRAAAVDIDDIDSMIALDKSLRSPDHRLNPGTTADLIAAGLYVLLRRLPSPSKQTNR